MTSEVTPFLCLFRENTVRFDVSSLPLKTMIIMAEEKELTQEATQQENINESNGQNMHSVSIMRRYSKADIISFIVTTAILIASLFITAPFMKVVMIILAILSLFAPVIVVRIIERNSFSLVYVHKVLSEAGLNPIIVDGEVQCVCNGKETKIRVHNGAMFQLSREYQISTNNNIEIYARAAAATTREVCSVKVGVRRDSEEVGSLVFSAESFCPSAKVFRQVFTGYMQALDVAEQRQGDNLKEILNKNEKPRRKIGFITSSSN